MGYVRRLLLGSGRMPDDLRATLDGEDVLLLEEGLYGSITYRNFRSPGRRSNWKRSGVSGGVACTARRFLVWVSRSDSHLDVPHDHPRRNAMAVTAEEADRVCIAYDAPDGAKWSGRVELRFRTAQANRIAELFGP
jgi:hypothetical protein